MALSFAELNDSSVVLSVVVISETDAPNEAAGITFCKSLFGTDTIWKQSGDIDGRKNRAAMGYTYNDSIDAFVAPKPYPSWTLNSSTGLWEPPVDYPADSYEKTGNDIFYEWNESEQRWDRVE